MPCTELGFELNTVTCLHNNSQSINSKKNLSCPSEIFLYLNHYANICHISGSIQHSWPACPPLWHTGLASEFGISDGINYLTAWDFVVGIACLDYRLWICQHIYLCLQRMCLTWSLWTDEMKGISFWLGANESLNPEGLWGVSCKQTHTQTHACRPHVCHADPACFASLLGSHERRVSTEWGSSRGRMPGESAAGDETSSRAAANGRAWQVHAQAGPYGASTGLGGFTAWLGVFSVSKLGWCESMTGHWKPQKWNGGNKGIPPHTLLNSGNSCNQD